MGLFVLLISTVAILFGREILTRDDGVTQADAIVVLGGGSTQRSECAAALFRQGGIPKVVVSGEGDWNLNVQILEKNGVSASAIVEETHSASTLENAEFSVPLLRRLGARRVIVVTSWYHSRRALACFQHFAPDIVFYSRPSYLYYSRREWYAADMVKGLGYEYLKLLGYWVRYGVSPFLRGTNPPS